VDQNRDAVQWVAERDCSDERHQDRGGLVLTLAELCAVLLPPGPALARGLHRNQVSKDGFIVTITVPSTCTARKDILSHRRNRAATARRGWRPSGRAAPKEIWNSGLAAYQYRGCYTFKVDVTIDVIAPGQAGSSDHHHVWLMWTNYRSHVYPRRRQPAGADNNSPYEARPRDFGGRAAPGRWHTNWAHPGPHG